MTTFTQKHIANGGRFKTAAGWLAEVDAENCTDTLLVGHVICPTGHRMPLEWNVDGSPVKLPTHHSLDLVPLREVISYEVIPLDERV